MKRGWVVLTAVPGTYGKVRPALVVQSDTVGVLDSITLCLLTSDLATDNPVRVAVEPDEQNGLRTRSHIQIDKVQTVPTDRVRAQIGTVDTDTMQKVDRALALHLHLYIAAP